MFNIDNSINNILKNKNAHNLKRSSVSSPNRGFFTSHTLQAHGNITSNVVNNMMSQGHIKPASVRMQMQWKGFNTQQKNIMRQKYKDTDGDRIPDRWDCKPNNPFMTMAFKYPTEQEMKNQGVRRVSYPVKKLYNMRADGGGLGGRKKVHHFVLDESYKEEDRIRTNIENEWKEKNKDKIESINKMNEILLDDAASHNELDSWHPISTRPPYPERKEVLTVYAKELKDKWEKENNIKLGNPKITKEKYNYYASVPIKYTKEQLRERRKEVMTSRHTDIERGEWGPHKPNSPESDKYMNDLTEAIQSEEPLVPPIQLEKGEVKGKYMGEGRHRINALQRLGQKNVDILVPDTWDYKTEIHKGNLKLIQRTPEETHQWHMERAEPHKHEQLQWNKQQPLNNLMGDNDNDGVINALDCEPDNPDKQGPGDDDMFLPDGTLNPHSTRVRWGAASKVTGKIVRYPKFETDINPATGDIEKQLVGYGKRTIKYDEEIQPSIKDVARSNKQASIAIMQKNEKQDRIDRLQKWQAEQKRKEEEVDKKRQEYYNKQFNKFED